MPNQNPDEPSEVGGADPHVFTDPVRAAQMVAGLTEALVKLVPAQKAQLEQRSAAYQAELRQFADQASAALKPYAGRHVVTLHAGFDYFLARCGLPPAHVVTAFPGKEPSAQYLETLGRKAGAEHIKVIFAEPQLSPKAAEVLARDIGGQVLILDYLGNPDDPTRDTYLKNLQFDLDELLKVFRKRLTVGNPGVSPGAGRPGPTVHTCRTSLPYPLPSRESASGVSARRRAQERVARRTG